MAARDPRRLRLTVPRVALAMGIALALLGTWSWILHPDRPTQWLSDMLLPTVLCGMVLYRRRSVRSASDPRRADRAAILRYFDSVMVISVASGCPILVRHVLRSWSLLVSPVDPDTGRRIIFISVGIMFVVVGNRIPKILTPLSMLPPGRAGRQQEARRSFGLVVVLLGLTVGASAMFLPLDLVREVIRWALVVGALALVAAIVWMNTAPPQPEGQT